MYTSGGFQMLTYRINIAGLDRDLPVCKVNDSLYIAGLVIFGDVELTVRCASALLAIAPEYDYMISPEAKSIPLIYEMARQSGANKYFLARKSPKLYMRGVFESDVVSMTTAHPQKLYLDIDDANMMKGKRILIVDDVVSTGESVLAVEELVNKAGGVVAGKVAILAEGAARNRKDILFLSPLPLFNADGTIKG